MTKIQDAIEIMTRIIDGGIDNFHAKDKEKETIHHNEEDKSNESCHDIHEEHQNETEKELKKQKQVEENFKLHDALDCRLLLEEFRKLFAQKPTSDYEDNATAIIEKLFQGKSGQNVNNVSDNSNSNEGENKNGNVNNKKKNFYGNLKSDKNKNSAEIFRFVRNNNKKDINNNNSDASVNDKSHDANKQEDMVFTNFIKNRLESKDPNEISMKQYNKYKSLLLAFEETKKCLNNPDSSVASGNTGHNTKSTGFTVSQKKSIFNKNNLNNKYQPQQFQFRSDFYSNTVKDWNKKANLLGSGKNQSSKNNEKFNNNFSIGTNNNSPDKLGKTGFDNNSYKLNSMSKKIKLPDPQYNFNYQAKYFGNDQSLDKNNHKYGNFLLPLLNKKEKEKNHDNDFVPKTLLMELKQRNEL